MALADYIYNKPTIETDRIVIRPMTIEDVQESERRYIDMYLDHPIKTDLHYMWKIITNIIFKGVRSK